MTSEIEEFVVGGVLIGLPELHCVHTVIIRRVVCIIQCVDQRVILILAEVFLNDLYWLLVDLVILVSLQIFQIVEAILIFHEDRELVLTVLIDEVLWPHSRMLSMPSSATASILTS